MINTVRLFPGQAWAASHEPALQERVVALQAEGKHLSIGAVLFTEDQGSQLYTRLKREAAHRVGIEYQVHQFSLRDELEVVQKAVEQLATDTNISGIIIQKPWRQTWLSVQAQEIPTADQGQRFQQWWQSLTSLIPLSKDVDGLVGEPDQADSVGRSVVLPATCRAVIEILNSIDQCQQYQVSSPLDLPADIQIQLRQSIQPQWSPQAQVAMIGKSDLLGYPLAAWLKFNSRAVTLLGKKELAAHLEAHGNLQAFPIVVSATGQAGLIQPEWLAAEGVFVDVGEPKSDLNRSNLDHLKGWVTPVPGGVGPLTVVSLLENCLDLSQISS